MRPLNRYAQWIPCFVLFAVVAGCDGGHDPSGDHTPDGSDAVDAEADAATDATPDAGEPSPDAPGDAARDGDDLDAPDPSDGTGDMGADAPDASDADVEADTGPIGSRGTVGSAVTCASPTDVCATLPVDGAIHASYRKDRYFPDSLYNEYTDPPLDGGRFHIAGIAAVGGDVLTVRIDGVATTDRVLAPAPTMEWWHVWPDPLVAGEPVWVAFHSRDPAWDAAATGTLEVITTEGSGLSGTFPVVQTPAPLTWVTTTDDRTQLLVHARNDDTRPATLERLLVNGGDVLSAGHVCGPTDPLAPGEAGMWTVSLCAPLPLGSAWTVVADWRDQPDAVGVGRVLRPFFPIEAWPNRDDCAVPTASGGTEWYQAHVAAFFDTMYYYWGARPPRCPTATRDAVNTILTGSDDGMHVLIGDDFFFHDDAETGLTDLSRVAGFLTGDESDGEIYLDDGSPAPEDKAATARRLWRLYPEAAVYNGGKTNGHVGTFAGMVDVQGMDLYVAACAPHITYDPQHPPLRGAYDYLRNTRDNHMPLPTWLYAQGLHAGWNRMFAGETVYVQPTPAEVLVQAFSVMAAGGKGLMWFQTDREAAEARPESWQAIADSNRVFDVLRRFVREGDPSGMVATDAEVIAEAIVAPGAIVVPVINLAHTFAPTDLRCVESIFDPSLVPHWQLAPQRATVSVGVPATHAVGDVFELRLDGTLAEVDYSADPEGRRVTLHSLPLDEATPVRVVVLAGDDTVRTQVRDALRP